MGNEQSAPAPRGQRNKLSKPRTNSSANTANSKSLGPPSRRNSQLNDVGVSNNRYSTMSLDVDIGEVGEKRRAEPQRKRMSIFRSKSSQAKVQQLEINSAVDIEYLEPADRWSRSNSRSNSVTEEMRDQRHNSAPMQPMQPMQRPPPPRTARMSLQHVPYSQHQARLSLVPEAPSPQPDPQLQRRNSILPEGRQSVQRMPERTIPERRQSGHQYDDESQKLSAPLSTRTNSDTALYAPIRRRSLLQHGVATRNSWIEKEPRQSLPPQGNSQIDLQNYYYNPAKPTSSPLSHLANLGAPKFEENVPGPRVATPNDLDYGHIGAYKLGSLRITNGAASPAPSIERPSTTDDYISAGEARRSAEAQRYELPPRSNTISDLPPATHAPWMTRAESPLRQEYIEVNQNEKVAPLQPLTIDTHLPLPEFSLFKFNDADSPTRSLDLARGYQEDLALSPFSFDNSPVPSPQLQSTSKHMAVEDDLFEPEPGTPEVAEFRPRKSVDSGYRTEAATPLEPKTAVKWQSDLAPKPLAKADSGYSSNVSLRSFRANPPPATPAKDVPPPPPNPISRVASSTYSVASSPSTKSDITIRTKRSLPALPVEEEMPAQPFRQPPPVPLKHSSLYNSGKDVPAPSLPPKSPDQTWAAAQARPYVVMKPHQHTRSQSIPSVSRVVQEDYRSNHSPSGSEASTSSTGSGGTSRWRRRSSSRSNSQSMAPPKPIFTVQAFHAPSDQFAIPPVSSEAQKRLEERVDSFPVACFPNTERGNPAIRRTVSKETLGTIFSVGSAEWREELTYQRLHGSLPAVPTEATIPESPTPRLEFDRRNSYQAPLPKAPPFPRKPMAVRQSLQGPRDDPALQRKVQQDFETEITSFDNISSSLGRSPYDAALSASPDSKRKQQERAKSMTAQFEADAAARFARARTVSAESQYSQQTLQRATSYDSITNQNPWSGGSSAGNSRVSSRELPPSTHANQNVRPHSTLSSQRSNPNLRDGEDKRHSLMSIGRMRSPPPVSMQTQRSSSHIGSQIVNPPSKTPPQRQQQSQFAAPPPNRTPPQPPAHAFSRADSEEKEVFDPWEKQKGFWASRKEEALQTRKSMELKSRKSMELQSKKSMEMHRPLSRQPSFQYDHPIPRPESARPSMEYQRPHPHPLPRPESARPSMDYQRPQVLQSRKSMDVQESRHIVPRPASTRPSIEYQRPQFPKLSHHNSYDNFRPKNYGPWIPSREPQFQQEQEYSFAYGSNPHPYPYPASQQEAEYYDSPSQDFEEAQKPNPRSVSNTSTASMLILDRFAGGLGYGYEPGYGLGGSAGTRNVGRMAGGARKGVGVSVEYGVDLEDVPVFLGRVGVGRVGVGS